MVPVQTIADLSDEEIERRGAELVAILGAEEGIRIHWRMRIAVAPDGSTVLKHKRPALSSEWVAANMPGHLPWHLAHGLEVVEDYGPVGEVIALLRGPSNPEAEVAYRQKAFEAEAAEHQARERDRIAAAREQRAAEEKHRRERPDRWAKLPRELKVLFLAEAKRPRTPGDAIRAIIQLMMSPSSVDNEREPPDTFEPGLAPVRGQTP